MTGRPVKYNRGWTRGQVALAFIVLTFAIAGGLAIYSSATSLIGLWRTASSVLFLPLLLSLVLAFLLDPVVTQLEKFFTRTGSIFILYILLLGLAFLFTLGLTPHWQSFWSDMTNDFPRYTSQITDALRNLMNALHDRFPTIATYDVPTRFRA